MNAYVVVGWDHEIVDCLAAFTDFERAQRFVDEYADDRELGYQAIYVDRTPLDGSGDRPKHDIYSRALKP